MALPIGEGQTISPPFIVAYMTEAIDPQPGDKVLEIGTGSGYQAAVLSKLVSEVYTIEIVARARPQGRKDAESVALQQRSREGGRRLSGLARTCPVRQDHCHLLARERPRGLDRTTQGRRHDGHSLRRAIPANALPAEEDRRQAVSEPLQPVLFVPMTGKAEAQRKVLPDPTRPAIENGGFESVAGDPPAPTGWYYQRQLELIGDKDAPRARITSPSRTPRPDAAARRYRDFPSTVARWSSCEFQREFAAATFAPARTRSSGPPSSSISTTNTVR